MRQLALEYSAAALGVWPNRATHRQIFDSLELESRCNSTVPGASTPPVPPQSPSAAISIFVDYEGGVDTAAGTIGRPLKTVAAALARVAEGGGDVQAIVLRAGSEAQPRTHPITTPVHVHPLHCGKCARARGDQHFHSH